MRAYSITAPEEIAKKYGGNKRKIQQAAFQGIINPTEAVTAGMFIDRMRNAAAQEQAQQPTVAEQVMNPQPPMPPQGMAAMPQAQQMPPQARQMPQQAQMGQSSPQAMMAARGGMLTIPYDEGDYAEGGIVGFSKGAVLDKDQMLAQLRQQYLAAGNAQERADIQAKIDNIMKMGTVVSPGGQAVTDSRLNQGSSFTGAVPLAETDLEGGRPYPDVQQAPGQLGFQLPAAPAAPAAPRDDSTQYPADTVSGRQYPDVPTEMGQLDFQLPAVTGSPGQAVPMTAGLAGTQVAKDFGVDAMPLNEKQQAMQDSIMRAAERRANQPFLGRRFINPDDKMPTRDEVRAEFEAKQAAKEAAKAGSTVEDRRGSLAEQVARMQTGTVGRRITDPEEIARLEATPEGIAQSGKNPNAQTVAEQIAQTEKAAEAVNTKRSSAEEAAAQEQANVPTSAEKEKGVGSFPADLQAQFDQQYEELKPQTYDDFAKTAQQFMPETEYGEYRKEIEALLKDRDGTMKKAKKESFNMALVQAGLGLMAQGGGQTALQALGKAAMPAVSQYAKDVKDLKKEDRELLRLGLSLEQMDAKEKAATKRMMYQMYSKQEADKKVARAGMLKTQYATEGSLQAATINAEKPTDLQRRLEIRQLDPTDPRRIALEADDVVREKIAKASATVAADAKTGVEEVRTEADIKKALAKRRGELEDSRLLFNEARTKGVPVEQLITEKLATYEATLRGTGGQTQTQGIPLPANPTAANLQKGTVYQTSLGPGRWNGKKFEAVQ